MKKINLSVKGTGLTANAEKPESNGCRTHMVVLPGYGKKDFPFPDTQTLVIKALSRLEKRHGAKSSAETPEQQEQEHKHDHGSEGKSQGNKADATEFGDIRFRIPFNHTFIPGLSTKGTVPQAVISKLPEAEKSGVDGTLYLAAEGIRAIMDEGKYDAIVAERFDPLSGAVNWAASHMEAKYQPAIRSLGQQLGELSRLYKEALPRVLAVLAAQNPDVPADRLLQASVQVLDEEMAQILFVLRVWTDAFAQHRDGMYKQLEAVVFTVETAFKLFETGDLEGRCHKGTGCKPKLENQVFKVGNVFLARFSGQGPATLPGSAGPIGAHAIEVPHDERHIIPLMLVLYTHEFRHDIFADVQGLAGELTHAVVNAIQEAYEAGKFKFSTDKIAFGRNKINTVDLLAKMYADTIGEVDADISGGVLLSGPAFLYNMISTFSAFNAKPQGSVIQTDRLLRTGSGYTLTEHNGQLSLEFLPHPPDYIRAYIVAAALDEIGFTAEADECRRLADQAAGSPLPEFITWQDAEGKSKAVIKISCDDIKQVAPVVAKALMRTPLKSLGGLSTIEIINWTPKRQAKVDILASNLMHDSAEVPADKGDFYATYVAAASTLAYWGLVKSGVRPLLAAHSVTANALKMLDTVRERLNNAPPTTHSQGCDCGKKTETSEGDSGKALAPTPATGETPAPEGASPAEPESPATADSPVAKPAKRRRKSAEPKAAAAAKHPGAVYIHAHYAELPAGQWVACTGDAMVAHGESLDDVLAKVAEAGLQPGDVACAFIEAPGIRQS